MALFKVGTESLATTESLVCIALGMAIGWALVLETSKSMMYRMLSKTTWWKERADQPTRMMMKNFGFPSEPTKTFPNAITEEMSRDFYAFMLVICAQHMLSALPMLPVLINGWEGSTEVHKCCFMLGTMSDVAFNVYDMVNSSIRTFLHAKFGRAPLPVDFFIILCLLHHTLALALVIPLNLRYPHRWEYHQLAFSLLMAASVCYLAGCYKFTLDVKGSRVDFFKYKLIVLFQFGVILYTRAYLWFPTSLSLRAYIRDQNDTTFFYGCTVMVAIFSVFNLILVADASKAVVKWLPRSFPESKLERQATQSLIEESSALDFPDPAAYTLKRMKARRRFKGAVHSVIASKRMASSTASESSKKSE